MARAGSTGARLASTEAAHAWLVGRGVRALRADSRRVGRGDAFLAWPGQGVDARRFVADALAAGAGACLVEAAGAEAFAFDDAGRVASIDGLKRRAGEIASLFWARPSERLDVVAVTGTNGKTSTAWWVAQALTHLGRRCGFIGTLGVGEPPLSGAVEGEPPDVRAVEREPSGAGAAGAEPSLPTVTPRLLPRAGERAESLELVSTGLTTPGPIELQEALRGFVDRGLAACAIEASSIGLVESRLTGTAIAVAVFTNFTQDHLDFHGDMASYWQAKASLFDWPGLKAAIVNVDDARGAELAATLAARASIDCWTTSVGGAARLRATSIRHERSGLAFEVREVREVGEVGEVGDLAAIATPLIGAHNVANLLAVVGVLRALGVGLADAAAACSSVTPVPGRMQRVSADGQGGALPEVIVDYAHTPDALDKALTALAPLARERGGRLWCVFGCGGNRDAAKRPLMGAVACRHAGRVVLTSDNPRDEPPDLILAQILAGVVGHDEVDVIENRAEAIRHAVASAAPADVVLIAGKGHEDTQDIGGVKTPFVDAEHAAAALRARAASSRGRASPTAAAAASATAPRTSFMMTLGDAAALVPSARLVGDPATPIARVHSDTRSLRRGDLFVALKGERFDAHDFLAEARGAGAVAAIAERGLEAAGLPGLVVANARAALGELAAAWRRGFAMPLVAVAGSNGKTTVTQMIASIFRAAYGIAAFATEGNFNNDVGVPLTLLRLRDGVRGGAAVVELGMNHPGEIARLAAIAAPTIALVNNAQREHLEFMADVDAVANENGAAIAALADDGIAVFPADDAHAPTWRRLAASRRTSTFAFAAGDSATRDRASTTDHAPSTTDRASTTDRMPSTTDRATDPASATDRTRADVTGHATWHGDRWHVVARTPAGELRFALRVAGVHNVRNALAATAAALATGCGLDAIARGLEAFTAVGGRSQTLRCTIAGRTATLVDDSYNANPDSVRAAIDVLATLPAPRWLVLGDMGEVGDEGPAFHREVGAYAAERGVDALWAVGPESGSTVEPFAGARAFADVEALVAALPGAAPGAASVLVKGSRFMRMERVVAALTGTVAKDAHAA